MASKYPEEEFQLEADSDNEVILVRRKPDYSQAQGDATRIPGRPDGDGNMLEMPNSLVLESSKRTPDTSQAEVLTQLVKDMKELKAFLVKGGPDQSSLVQGDKGRETLERHSVDVPGSEFNRELPGVSSFQVNGELPGVSSFGGRSSQGKLANPCGSGGPFAAQSQTGVTGQMYRRSQMEVAHGTRRSAGPSFDVGLTGSHAGQGINSLNSVSWESNVPIEELSTRGISGRVDGGGLDHPIRKKPATFDGTGSWNDYLTQFELVADLNQWCEEIKAMELATSLRGQAQSILTDLLPQQRRNFSALSKALEARFEPVNQSEMYRAQLKTRIRKRGESLTEFAQDMKRLIRKAYPKATPDLREKLTCDAFTDLLNDNELEWAIYQTKPSSVEDAVRAGLEFESFRVGRQKRSGAHAHVRMVGDDWYTSSENDEESSTSALKEVAGRLAQLMDSNKESNWRSRDFKKFTCYYCNQEGHLKRNCPKFIADGRPKYTPYNQGRRASQSSQTEMVQSGN